MERLLRGGQRRRRHAYGDGDAYRNPDCDHHAHRAADGHSNDYGYIYRDGDRDGYGNRDADTHSYGHAYRNGARDHHTHRDTDGHGNDYGYIYRNPDCDRDGYGNRDADTHSYGHAYRNGARDHHTNRDADGHGNDYGYAYPNTDCNYHANRNANGNHDRCSYALATVAAAILAVKRGDQMQNCANTLTLGAYRVLADWVDSQANRVQRKTGVNWQVAGMGSGSDYTATADATVNITGAGGAWLELDVTNAAQAWVSNAAGNYGLVLLQEAASGYVTYDFCSELGWSPCSAAQAPKLTLRYHLVEPAPVKATFQQGANGYSGNNATYFDPAYGYNYAYLLQVGANNATKSLLRFDIAAIPVGKTVDEATLRLYYKARSNSNSLTLGAHQVLNQWVDSQANWSQRKTGVNWQVAGMGSGSDYTAAAAGTTDIAGGGGSWVELDVTDLAQAWVTSPASNNGLVLLQEAAGGSVTYDFCSELGWSPCSVAQAPKLTVWYH